MGSPIETIGLYRRTLPHHKRSQLWWRVRFLLRKRIGGRRAPMPKIAPQWNDAALDRLRQYAREYSEAMPVTDRFMRVLRDKELLLLNYPVNIAEAIPWHANTASKLWRYNLHYLDWCRWLALNPEVDADTQSLNRNQAHLWLIDWQIKNPPGNDISWDPFVVTQRLLNWSLIQAELRLEDELLARSFAQQAAYLSRNLERDVLANHLLKNLCALTVAGTLMGGAQKTELGLLEGELSEQVLPDGGHFERSPMYHLQALEDLLVAHAALESPPVFLTDTLKRMVEFAGVMRHPDGDIALFNDAARDPMRPADRLLSFARKRLDLPASKALTQSVALPDSGFYVLAEGDAKSRMIIKAGEHGPGYQMGHAHGDLLSYELSIDGKRLIVDSGVQGYSGDILREYCRSTRAHNTVSLSGAEQLETWSVFRVGRRGKAKALRFEAASYGQFFYGEHNAFEPFVHRRRIHCDRLGLWFVLDEITGPGKIEAESFLHFHPLWTLAPRRGYYSVRITETVYRVFLVGNSAGTLCRGQKDPFQQGWYCPELGKSQQNWCLTLRAQGENTLRFGYAIVPAEGDIRTRNDLNMYVGMLDQEHGFDNFIVNADDGDAE